MFIGVLLVTAIAFIALPVVLCVAPIVFVAWVIFMSIWAREPPTK